MLSLPDFQEKQIIIIESGEEKKMQFRNDNLLLCEEGKILNQVSCYKIFCIFVIGDISVTTVLIKKALSYGISFIFMNKNFKTYAVIGAETEGNTLLRKRQYGESCQLEMAKHIVINKIMNQLSLLKGIRKKSTQLKSAIVSIVELIDAVKTATDYRQILGYEGNVSKLFFASYFADYAWHARLPRTKYDPTNTLMDIGYTYLFNFIDALLRLYGFDTYLGFYHKEFYQRKSLVCDVVEPFRCIIDKKIRNAYSLGQVQEKDFSTKNRQYDLQYKEARKYTKLFVEAIMERKEDIFTYVQSFYRAVMKEDVKNLPLFTI